MVFERPNVGGMGFKVDKLIWMFAVLTLGLAIVLFIGLVNYPLPFQDNPAELATKFVLADKAAQWRISLLVPAFFIALGFTIGRAIYLRKKWTSDPAGSG